MKPVPAAIRRTQKAWELNITECHGCGISFYEVDAETHHMERRSHWTGNEGHHPCNLLRLCRRCHAGDFAAMPHAEQLAYKLLYDPEHFDLTRWLQIKDPELRAPDRVTLNDIAWAIRESVRKVGDESPRPVGHPGNS